MGHLKHESSPVVTTSRIFCFSRLLYIDGSGASRQFPNVWTTRVIRFAAGISMLTDAPPRKNDRSQFSESDRIKTLELPEDRTLLTIATVIDSRMRAGVPADVRRASAEFLAVASNFYQVPNCGLRVLENWTSELFGDYHPETMLIRVWMRTAIRKEITSYGTFLSTLCHEFCHHLDFQRFGFRDSWHTRGFYERAAALYHHARKTAPKKLVWVPVRGERFRIDWPRTNRLAQPLTSSPAEPQECPCGCE